ncbi:MAG: hypothetical protein R3237_04080 [Nitrosopumilaceae archaeon]|nr:hypothetical protein [Nitrosopumilaceae archaeon]
MNKLVIVCIVVAIIVGIIFGLIYYSYTQIHVSFTEVSSVGVELEQLSFSTLVQFGIDLLTGNWLDAALNVVAEINLGLIFEVTNNGLLPVYIPEISYELFFNDILMGEGITKLDMTLNPGETKEIPIMQSFKKDSLSPAMDSIIDTEGVIEIGVRGKAYFELLGQEISIPFESSKQVSIVDEIQAKLTQQNLP